MGSEEKKRFDRIVLDLEHALVEPESDHFAAMETALREISQESSTGGLLERGISGVASSHWYTRLAAAVTSVIVDPGTVVNLRKLTFLCGMKQQLAYIFSASGYRSTGHLLDMMSHDQDGKQTIKGEKAAVLLSVLPLDGMTPFLLDLAKRQPPEVLLRLTLGWLAQRAVITEQAEKARTEILSWGPLIEDVEIDDSLIRLIAHVWMYCSYAESAKKHDIKASLNKLLRQRMVSAGLMAPPITHVKKPRPKVLVVHERFNEKHAMYRCYASWISDLRDTFDLVALAEETHIDGAADQLFDEVIAMPSDTTVSAYLAEVNKVRPDIIYYPSIGMSHWVIMLANLRLAPIQVMTHGHPATSQSPAIDYAYIPALRGEDIAQFHSERVVIGPDEIAFVPHEELPEALPELLPPSEREVRIAVVSKVMKLSYRLMDICKRLQKEAEFPVAFSFFPGERWLFYDGLVPAIQAQIPNASVFPYTNYDSFLRHISRCDIALAAFPFGNTNSTIDTCLLGMPTVAHFGPESPAQSDSVMLKNAGLADWLVCDTDDQYFEVALSLINNKEQRKRSLSGLGRAAIKSNLFPSNRKQENPFAKNLRYIFENHSSLRSSGRRVFDYRELLGE